MPPPPGWPRAASYDLQDLVEYGRGAAVALRDVRRPSICPVCFNGFAFAVDGNGELVDALRKDHHDFWDACNRMATAERTDAELAGIAEHLAVLRNDCPRKQQHANYPPFLSDPWHILLYGIYICLYSCVKGGSRPLLDEMMPKTHFSYHARGWWPSSPEQLFSLGAKRCVEAHALWGSKLFMALPYTFLAFLLIIARPVILPHLLSPATKRRVVWTMIQMLHASSDKPVSHWEGEPAGSQLPAQFRDKDLVEAAVRMLMVLHEGPGASPKDAEEFTRGYERPVLSAVQAGLDGVNPEENPDGTLRLLCVFALGLHIELREPESTLDPRVTQFYTANAERRARGHCRPGMVQYGDEISGVIFSAFGRRADARSCAGPGCNKVMLPEGTVFKQCSGCKFTRYCSQDCQRADWRQEPPLGHKGLCPVWRKLFAAGAHKNMTDEEFLQAFRRASLAQPEKSDLLAWALYDGFQERTAQNAAT